MIFLDTSAVYALADRDDPRHERAKELFHRALDSGEDFLLHSYILVEAASLIKDRLGLGAALRFLKESEAFQIHWVTPRDHFEAVALFERHGRRGLSFVDCVSFVVMRRYAIKRYLGFKEGFKRHGFEPWGELPLFP